VFRSRSSFFQHQYHPYCFSSLPLPVPQHQYHPYCFSSLLLPVSQHQYADDTQLCISLSPSNFPGQIHRLDDCLIALHTRCYQNSLTFKPDKSESVLFGTRQRSRASTNVASINVAGSVVHLADHVKLLGVTLDNRLSMDKHVNEVSRACFYHLRALRRILSAITPKTRTGSLALSSARGSAKLTQCCTTSLRRT